MKIKRLPIPALLVLFIVSFLSTPGSAFIKKDQEKKEQEANVIIIPDRVKSIFEEGMTTREARLDIPFSVIWNIYLPAQQNLHCVFYFKVKNADLGFFPVPPAEEEKKEEKTSPAETETPTAQLQASGHVFLQFNRLETDMPQEVVREVYIPLKLKLDSEAYEPDKEEIYSTGYPIPSGNYLLSMAIASEDLGKIGTQYYEFSLPDVLSPEEMMTTPIFFIREIKRMPTPEMTAEVHKEFFTYSVLQITPKVENIFSAGENLDIFFFVFGATAGEEGKFDIDVNYEVTKGEETVIRYQTAHYEAPIVSQPLPMKKTVLIKSEEGERKEQRDLEAGTYTLHITIEDKITGSSVKKSVDIEVQETAQ